MRHQRTCAECGKEFSTPNSGRRFCGLACKRVFNNRRQRRGAQVYDLVMLGGIDARLDERLAECVKLWRADDAKHGRKRSWKPAQEILYSPIEV
jgi:hypothetical protein